eukprot:5670270-Pyramimonas_sp.AAC.1
MASGSAGPAAEVADPEAGAGAAAAAAEAAPPRPRRFVEKPLNKSKFYAAVSSQTDTSFPSKKVGA